jgi:uncharacterized membrane protein SpoIIM required for sporulation
MGCMLAEDFINAKKSNWERLTDLIKRSQLSGLAGLSAEELIEMGRLYRGATSDLAVARRDFTAHRVTTYLNDLVGCAHGTIYQSRAARKRNLLDFVLFTFPRTFRATWPYTLASFLMMFLPALIAFVITFRDPTAGSTVVPGVNLIIDDIRNGREWWLRINEQGNTLSGAEIMTNNIRVTFLAFAGGVFLGALTFYVLLQNGLLLGTIAGASQALGFADNLWGFVAAHGTIELTVIFIAGGSGLQLGWSILRPGLLTRRTSLVRAAQRAIILLIGCVPLLVLAGLIEGYISPSSLPLWVKLAVSLGSGILLYGYLILAGRQAKSVGPKHTPL